MIPADVRRFVMANIGSVPQLEALLLLRAEAAKEWTAEVVSRRLFVEPAVAARLLDELCERGLIVHPTPAGYRYEPRSEELRIAVDQLAETHARALIPLTQLIHVLRSSDASQFADAFRLRKGD